MTGSQVAEQQQAGVPALRKDVSREITARDVSFPRLYTGNDMSKAVKKDLVNEGDLFVAQDQYDTDPVVLAKVGSTDGVIVHVLDMIKGWSISIDGDLKQWRYDDPERDPDAWTTYNYFVAIPQYADDIPVRWLITRSATPTAKKINTVLSRASEHGPIHTKAFRVTTETRSNKKGEWYVPVVEVLEEDETDDKYLAVAEKLASKLGQKSDSDLQAQATAPEPAI